MSAVRSRADSAHVPLVHAGAAALAQHGVPTEWRTSAVGAIGGGSVLGVIDTVVALVDTRSMRTLLLRALAAAPARRLLERALPRVDRAVFGLTGGRTSLSALVSGLPVVLLTTTGARTGRPRRALLLGLHDGDRIVVTAANWGGPRNPAWYHNLLAQPRATVTVDRQERPVVAHEADGQERDRLWRLGLERMPAQLGPQWADNPYRRIPVMVLTPRAAPPDR